VLVFDAKIKAYLYGGDVVLGAGSGWSKSPLINKRSC
jgi:hypothetical protein